MDTIADEDFPRRPGECPEDTWIIAAEGDLSSGFVQPPEAIIEDFEEVPLDWLEPDQFEVLDD